MDEYSPDVRIAIAEIEKLEMADRTPETLGLVGLAYLAVGDATKAVSALEEAAAAPAVAARVRTDLAAAYLVLALDGREAQDLPKALAVADLAAKSDPTLPEARFNRALALERLHLVAESRQAWQDYLRVDSASAWASEARSHLADLNAPQRQSAEEEWRRIESAVATGNAEIARTAVQQLLQPARDWTERQLLASWPQAILNGDFTGAGAILGSAQRIAESISALTGDRYLVDAVTAARRASVSHEGAVELARAHVSFQRAMARYDNNEFVESGRAFAALREPLIRAQSSFASAAVLQVSITAYYASDVDASARELDSLIPAASHSHYLRLLGLAHRMRGLVEFVRARFGQSFEHNSLALELFRTTDDRENVAAIESSLAENLEFLGEPRLAWAHRARALEGLSEVRSLRRRHTILISSVLSCLRQGSPEAAAYFQSAVLQNAVQWNRPEALAEAYVRQAELHGQTGDFSRVSGDLAEARRWTSKVPSGPLVRQIEARALLASASFLKRSDPELDESALTEALTLLRKAGLNWALAKAYLARGRIHVTRGRPDLAEADFLEGIHEFEKQRASLATEALRVSYFDQPWDLFSEMIRLQTTTRRRPDLALTYAERARARTLFEAVAHSDAAIPFDVQALQARLAPGVAIVYYAVLDYQVVIWRLTSSRLDTFDASMTEVDLTRLVNRFRAELMEPSSPSRESASQLYDVLVRAAVQSLPLQATVVFVPDGVLNALPFAALVDRGTGRFLIQDRSIAVAPSASVFIEASAAQRDRPSGASRTALVVGNPNTGDAESARPANLPDAGREVEEIAGLYDRAEAVKATDASKQRFLEEFDKYDVVHFAGHAISNSDFPALSRLLFATGRNGASGSLFVHELAHLHFHRTQLLVLAACQTSSGRIRRGEGVLSLARPFLAAGVPTVVASLWDADDRATRSLLVAFHAALRGGAPPARALRSAQLSILASSDSNLRLPSKWAGFIVIGSIGSDSPDETPRARLNRGS